MTLLKRLLASAISVLMAFPALAQDLSDSEAQSEQRMRLCTGEIETQEELLEGATACGKEDLQKILTDIQKMELEIDKVAIQIDNRMSNRIEINEGLLSVLSVTGFVTTTAGGLALSSSNMKTAVHNRYYAFKVKRNRVTQANRKTFERNQAKSGIAYKRMMLAGGITFGLSLLGDLVNAVSIIIVEDSEVSALKSQLNLLKEQYVQRKLALMTMQTLAN